MFITLGVEDPLSEAVAVKIVEQYAEGARIARILGLMGNDDLRKRLPSLNAISSYEGPAFVLTDLDSHQRCPAELVSSWTQGIRRSPNLVVRVAVLEIEAWIIADRVNFARWLGIAESVVPRAPEEVDDPKRALVQLASRSRNRTLRDGLVRDLGNGLLRPGPDYNPELRDFVNRCWDPEAARLAAPSLSRAIRRVSDLTTSHESRT